MNTHLKEQFDPINYKNEIEKLYNNINKLQKNKEILIQDEDKLKCELKHFGLKKPQTYDKDILTPEDYLEIKALKNNPNIVIRKADKSNTFVIFDKTTYNRKINDILSDKNKFQKIDKDPSDNIKSRLNEIIEEINFITKNNTFKKIQGSFSPGYMYGNAKIHKNKENPPLRPVISTIPTPGYMISKEINEIIKTYIPNNYCVNSTHEFVNLIKSAPSDNIMASLDIVSLFTNVPVNETIEIILNCVYNHETLPAPNIPKTQLKEILYLCTTKTPFKSPDGQLYTQIDGVSMGCVLGPTFANFYMGHIENKIFKSNLIPKTYCRYVDDIFVTTKSE